MKKIVIATLISIMAAAAIPGGLAYAKNGADNPAGDTRHGTDGAGHR